MRYLSVCSGIEAATVAWHPLGWEPAAFAEIDAFPRAVLRHHYPDVPLRGDFTEIGADDHGPIDLLVGGTPCQSFSVAGLRGGLGDDRGNMALEFLRLAGRTRPRWVVWENVPGVLSSNGGRDFGSILGGLAELGYGFAYRVLDAQFVRVDGYPRAVPQRRRRVFVVGYSGDWRPAAAVLLEREGLSGNPPPRRKAGEIVACTVGTRAAKGSGDLLNPGGLIASTGDVAYGIETTCNDYSRADGFNMVAHTLRGQGFDASEDGTGRGTPLVPVAFQSNASGANFSASINVSGTLKAGSSNGWGNAPAIGGNGYAVRRLTPTECERLQGFPDGYTAVPYRGKPADQCPDGPRYKALGNSMAVNVMRWIGQRIAMVDAIVKPGGGA